MCLLGLGGGTAVVAGGLQLDSVDAFEICDVFIEANISWQLLPRPKLRPPKLSTGTILKFSCAPIAAAGASVSNCSGASLDPIIGCSWQVAVSVEELVAIACACSCAARALLTFSDMVYAHGLHVFSHLKEMNENKLNQAKNISI